MGIEEEVEELKHRVEALEQLVRSILSKVPEVKIECYRLEKESSTASMRCIMARGLPKRLKQNLSIPSFVPTHVM
jgi:hypothetical protein